MSDPFDSARSGSALMLVLWSVALMAVLIGSFAFDAHIEGRITYYYRNRTKADYLARSGIEVARMLMIKQAEVEDAGEEAEGDDEDRWLDAAKRLHQGQDIRGLIEPLGEGDIILDIVPEPARRNVNLLKEEDWERILEVSNVPEPRWAELIESVQDWLDADDEARADGAETEDYYSTLESPYTAKNGPLDTVGELLLVKGFSRAIVFGGPLDDIENENGEPLMVTGIEDLLTTYGDGKVNINAASARVLMTLPDVDDLVAGAIIEEREGALLEEGSDEDTSFKDAGDLMARVPDLNPDVRSHVTVDSSIFRITSTGRVGGVTRRVWCIAEHDRGQLQFLRWREE
ncbi:MAG: general secretion pathway protein GspK [Lentisphaerae bacterium]|nr:general secretion pathway protein GspK [Lentisphaerota bacterium]